MPVDTFSKKIKGFASVTYMFPEHAVKAFTELDGKSFMVREGGLSWCLMEGLS